MTRRKCDIKGCKKESTEIIRVPSFRPLFRTDTPIFKQHNMTVRLCDKHYRIVKIGSV